MAICVGCGLTTSGGLLVVEVSPDACNGLECRGNGLYVPCPDSVTGIISNTSPQAGLLPFDGLGPSNTYDFDSPTISITNDLCCTVSGRLSVQVGGLLAGLEPTSKTTSSILVNPNGAGFGASAPDTSKINHNNGTGVLDVDFNNTQDVNWVIITAGATLTYQARFRLLVQTATAHFSGTVAFAFQWDLNQDGCC